MSKEIIKNLPKELREVLKSFSQSVPSENDPSSMMSVFFGEDREDFSLEGNETEKIEVAEWAFKKVGKQLPEMIPGVDDYLGQVQEFANLIFGKVYKYRYENDSIKPCSLYTDNEKVTVVGISARTALNKKCAEVNKTYEKGAIYAEYYEITEEFEKLSQWEKGLFYVYCLDNKASNTLVGKS